MGAEIDRGKIHQDEAHHRERDKTLAACTPCQKGEDDGYADMTAGESGSGAFACFVGSLHQLVEESVRTARDGELVLMGGEIIADVGEYPLHDIVETCSVVIVLGTRHWQGYEDDVIDKERSEDDERDALKILIPAEEIIESNDAWQADSRRAVAPTWQRWGRGWVTRG